MPAVNDHMAKDIKKIMERLNAADGADGKLLFDLVAEFEEGNADEAKNLVLMSRRKLAEVFTLDVLKNLDRHFVSADSVTLLMEAETVSDCKNVGAYLVSDEDGKKSMFIQLFRIKLTDGTEIHVINMQEEERNESN